MRKLHTLSTKEFGRIKTTIDEVQKRWNASLKSETELIKTVRTFNHFYVDDLAISSDNSKKLKLNISKTYEILNKYRLKLQKLKSNDPLIHEIFTDNPDIILKKDIIPVLGLTWNVKRDTLSFKVDIDKKEVCSCLSSTLCVAQTETEMRRCEAMMWEWWEMN